MKSDRQPKALYLLFAVQMWECFSFYGMRALLVLYLINHVGVGDLRAYGIYAIYCALVEFGGILGGRLADKFLGLRPAIVLGGWLIVPGHLCIALSDSLTGLFAGLSLIAVGSSLFSTNIAALLGLFYGEDDPRRERGYTWFYMGINVGALLASILCGVLGETWGWHYGFGLAALGMILGNVLLFAFQGVLEGQGGPSKLLSWREKSQAIFFIALAIPFCALLIGQDALSIQILPPLSLLCLVYFGYQMFLSGLFSAQKLATLALYLGALALFFAAEEQTGSALLVFSERYSTGTFLGMSIPNTALLCLNPLTIVFGGALAARLLKHAGKQAASWLVVLGLTLAAAAFILFAWACQFNESGVPLEIVIAGILVISMAELLIAPAVYAFCSQIAPREWLGVCMGLIPLAYSLASLLSGLLSQSMSAAETSNENALMLYSQGFGSIAAGLVLMAGAIAAFKLLYARSFKHGMI